MLPPSVCGGEGVDVVGWRDQRNVRAGTHCTGTQFLSRDRTGGLI